MGEQELGRLHQSQDHGTGPKEQAFWEGCLSVPDLKGLVHRPRKIRVGLSGSRGKAPERRGRGILATVFQHELDHLAGKLFVDRMKD